MHTGTSRLTQSVESIPNCRYTASCVELHILRTQPRAPIVISRASFIFKVQYWWL
jgi:hypothetical protein